MSGTNITHAEKFALEFPVKLADGRELAVVHLHRPKVRHLKQAQRTETDPAAQQIVLMALMTEEKLTPEDFDDIDLGDFMKMNAFFRRIMGDDQGAAAAGGIAGPVVPLPAQ
ncbi:phage tail assembly protein [Paraburkholderia sp.]|uniref:phage tail assembly protein n=1 Tax=Paraburkholderia sp. TaxID=1926495 RepID=UPI003D7013D5